MSDREALDRALRAQLTSSLRGGEAYDKAEEIFGEVPIDRRFDVPAGSERSAWQILDHMRVSLEDLIGFSDNERGDYEERDWPEGYWPKQPDPGDPKAWDASLQGFWAAQKRLEELINDPDRDLFAKFPWGDGQTLLREVLLAIQHNSYHVGELVELTRMLGPLGPGAL